MSLALVGRHRHPRAHAVADHPEEQHVEEEFSTDKHDADRRDERECDRDRRRQPEAAPTAELFTRPRHPYTEVLLSAVPKTEPDEVRQRMLGQYFSAAGTAPQALALQMQSERERWARVIKAAGVQPE